MGMDSKKMIGLMEWKPQWGPKAGGVWDIRGSEWENRNCCLEARTLEVDIIKEMSLLMMPRTIFSL